MNERIKELAEQAKRETSLYGGKPGDREFDERFNKMFAELIVRDLIDSMIKRYGDDDELPIQEIEFFVKEHFGVEE